MSKISVIVPIYKVEKFLNRCIDSILAQTFKNFDLILVDDGSSDNCPKICDDYAKKDKRVKVIHKKNGGLSEARNFGIDYALETDSEYITFIDSDDWVDANYLRFLYDSVNDNCFISVCDFHKTSDFNIDTNDVNVFNLINPEDFWVQNQINATVAWGKLYKKSLFNDVRFPVGKLHEDEFTTYKLLFSCKKIAYVSNKLYYYFLREESIMAKWSVKRLDLIDARYNQLLFFKKYRYKKAYNWAVSDYMLVLWRCLLGIKENYLGNEHLIRVKKLMKKHLLYNKNTFPIFYYKEYYELAFSDDLDFVDKLYKKAYKKQKRKESFHKHMKNVLIFLKLKKDNK